jgi:hypothetical protein
MSSPSSHCPSCNGLAAIASKVHCPSKSCTWNTCRCGTTYDRKKGTHYGNGAIT